MAAVIYYFVSLISVFKRKSKVLPVICAVLFWILINFSHDHADFGVYTRTFDMIAAGGSSSYEVLFVWLMKVISFVGVDYEGFRMIVSTVIVISMYCLIKKNSYSAAAVWGLYLIFSSIYDATLMRHLCGLPIILYAIQYLDASNLYDSNITSLSEESKKEKFRNDIYFITLVAIAALFHSAYWYFLVVWAVFKIRNIKNLQYFLIIFTIIGFLLTSTNIVFYIFKLLPIREHLIAKYMTGAYRNLNGRIFDLLKQGMIAGFGIYSFRMLRNQSKRYGNVDLFKEKISYIGYKLNFVMFTIVPFLAYTPVLQRLNRVLIIINYIIWSNVLSKMKPRTTRWLGHILIGLGFAIVLLWLLLFYESDTLETIFFMHFRENDFFSLLN